MRPRLLISVVSSLLFLIVPSLRAADVRWPGKFDNWTLVSQTSDRRRLEAELAIPTLRESGLTAVSDGTYSDGQRIANMTLYTFRDSSGAYEAYTLLKDEWSPIKISRFTIPLSNLLLEVWSESEISAKQFDTAIAWARSISDRVTSPPIVSYLPDEGRQSGSERYALGPVAFGMSELKDQVGFNSGAEAMFARYKSGKDEATLLLIEYPTPQLAELHLKHMQRAILALKNGASVERKGSLLSIVLAPSSQEYAEKLRASVNYETQVTWSEPSSTATDPPITSTLVKIFVATGVFMVVTVVVGIAFGGVRVITKRLFPGKVFDRPHQIEVLQLGLSSKPIDPEDLY